MMGISTQIKDIIILPGSGSPSVVQGADIPCSMAMVMAHPDNTDKVWVRPYAACDDTHKWPLESGDVVRFVVDNVNRLHFLFDTAAEKVIVAYADIEAR